MVFNPAFRTVSRVVTPFAAKYGAMMYANRSQRATSTNLRYRQGGSLTMTQTKKRKRSARPSFKNKLYDTMAAKHDNGEQQVALTQNTLSTLNLTARIVQGDSNGTRDGDAIVLCGLKLKGFFHSHTTANCYGYRIIVGYSGEEYNNTVFGSGLGASELFLPNTSATNTELGQINPKAFTVLHDERFTINSNIIDIRDREDFAIHVDLGNKMFSYQSAGSTFGKDKNLYVVVVGNVFGGSPGSTVAGGVNVTWDFVFKNAN